MSYQPNSANAELLNTALAIIKSVEYKPSLRWLQYQLLQKGLLRNKQVAFNTFKGLASKARKGFWNGWTPWTLADSIREFHDAGRGYQNLDEYMEAEKNYAVTLDFMHNQNYYVEVWYEAMAMHGQFKHILEPLGIPLLPFQGDTSISIKWEAAERLEKRYNDFGKPVVIIYFGDCDDKGKQIPQSAIKDIRLWCDPDFEFIVAGLTLAQAKKYKLPENPEKKGQYQWEALPDKAAKEIILGTVRKYWNFKAVESMQEEQNVLSEEWHTIIDDILERRKN